MPPRELSTRHAQMRIRIAQLAAQLIAEHGIRDYGLAKRKAARQLGAPDSHSLPGNEEIEAALRDYQALYHSDVHADHLRALRHQALEVMHALARFDPLLVGSVLNGTATRHADIDLEVHTDSDKDFEHHLRNQGFVFSLHDRGGQAYFLIHADPADVWIRLLPESQRHGSTPARGGTGRRADRARLARLIESTEADPAGT